MKKTGTIEALNVSPKGFYEGFLLRTGKRLAQINLPKKERGMSAEQLKVGETIAVEAESEESHGKPAHQVFRLIRLLDTNGHSRKNDTTMPRDFSAIVVGLNYALHGEVNGGILDSGDFLHLRPEGARAVKLKTGMQVEGRGSTRPMVGGHLVIEAEEVNGIAIHRHKAKKKHSTKHAKD